MRLYQSHGRVNKQIANKCLFHLQPRNRIEWKEGTNGVEKGQILHALGHIPAPPPIPKEEIKVEVTDGDGDDAALSPTSKVRRNALTSHMMLCSLLC